MEEKTPDFSGWATVNDRLCSDGLTIREGAFKHQNQAQVPLVWQHQHDSATNILGHAMLEDRAFGVYAYGFFNESPEGLHARESVKHGDVNALSIYANKVKKRNQDVVHGNIVEVSLVLAGANPGAFIDFVSLSHGEDSDQEAVIYTGLTLEHADTETQEQEPEMADETTTEEKTTADDKTVKDILDTLSEEQKNAVAYLLGKALEEGENPEEPTEDADDVEQSMTSDEIIAHIDHTIKEGITEMARNVFENGTEKTESVLSHSQIESIVKDAQRGGSLKDSVLSHADDYGITDIDTLFPDAKTITASPEFLSRRNEWVAEVLNGTKHSPFSRIKSVVADITADEARAKGYVKGNLKKDEVIKLLKRVTEPTTIYKKQKLDRDDVVDITDFDVVAWIKAEMRLMLDEEIARAVLIGDGRSASDDDKINEDKIRPIAKDDPMYAHSVVLPSEATPDAVVEALIRARTNYRGSGQPVLFTTLPFMTDLLLIKDKMGRRIYDSQESLASALMVSKIIPVEVMEDETEVVAIYVNLSDYTIGATRGGETSFFDDFDIDYNQQKYLIEARLSGSLTKPKSAIVIKRTQGTLVTPTSPSFNGTTNTITFPNIEGVEYTIDGIPVEGDEVITADTEVEARPKAGYSFPANTTSHWTFVYTGE